MDLSIIIPIYNSEKTIKRAIQSINLSCDYEIICVDDGSADNSKLIIDELKNDYPIQYVYQKNSGAAHARNHGLDLSTGEYITFIDSDDLIYKDGLAKMLDFAKNEAYDIVLGNIAHSINNKIIEIPTYKELFSESKATTLNETPEILQSIGPSAKLFKRESIINNRFDEDITFCEEHTFNCKAYLEAKIYIMNQIVYLYSKDNEDSTVSKSNKNVLQYLNDAQIVRERVNHIFNNASNKIENYYEYRMDKLIVYFLIKNNYVNVENKKVLIQEIHNYLNIANIKNSDLKRDFINLMLVISTYNYKTFSNICNLMNVKPSLSGFLKYKLVHVKWLLRNKLKEKLNKV